MRTPSIVLFFALTSLFSCKHSVRNQDEQHTSPADTLQPDSSKTTNGLEEVLKSIPKHVKPVFGYRFSISGDFDGDGNEEQLFEHFFSGVDNKETNKFYDSLSDYSQLVALTLKKEPISFVLSDNEAIDTLHISSHGQLLGLSYLKNEGDLNGDGTDEVSYVVHWADWSNLNTWHIMTLKNNRWITLYSFPIWESRLPDLPETFDQYGPFGLEQKRINTTNDTVNRRLEEELIAFPGLVKKMGPHTIQVIFRNDEAEEDTMMVDLKQLTLKE